MKVRIVKTTNEDLLDEAKEDDLIAKYSIGKGADKGNYDIHLFDFKKMLDWGHGAALKFAPGSTAKQMVANAKEITNTKDFVSKRKDRIKFLPWMMKMAAMGDASRKIIDAADIFEKYVLAKRSQVILQKNDIELANKINILKESGLI